jgi:acetyl-CoA acyltransferase 1|tara:strand:- start:1885 stop:3459 length:1575 start_codon:yes stop_codon:yes gene_type:complete
MSFSFVHRVATTPRASSTHRITVPSRPVPSRLVVTLRLVPITSAHSHHVARRGCATSRARHRQSRRTGERVRRRRFERGASLINARARSRALEPTAPRKVVTRITSLRARARARSHLASTPPTDERARFSRRAQRFQKSPDDVVIVSACRTPITRAKRGGLARTPADDLLATVLQASVERGKIDVRDVGDIVVGSVLGASSQRANECRIAMFLAGFPKEVPVRTTNRQCSSGLQACADVAAGIKAGYYDMGIGAGVETMTANPMKWEGGFNPRIASSSDAQNCLIPMGVTSENVAEKFGISREAQDTMAARSHARAANARATGRFTQEIVPVRTKNAEGVDVVVSEDDGIREGTTVATLAKLPAVFKKGGSTTPGNASQVSDGAAAVVLARRSYAEKHGLPILATWRSFAAVGCDPAIMGVGPAVAIPEALRAVNLNVNDVDLYELNEAFASQATYSIEKLGLDPERVNVNGGAIALGHPLGATGARCLATLIHEMHRRGGKVGICSMCIGSGMGAAATLTRDD